MRGVVVYESMYGNTHLVAEAIAKGLALSDGVVVVPVHGADQTMLKQADVIVVGGPTHVHGMSRESTRKAALDEAHKPGTSLNTDPNAEGLGLREWFESLDTVEAVGAAFDTRVKGPAALTGRASKGISKMLARHGMDLLAEPQSFLVDKDNHLLPGEEDRAVAWGKQLADTLAGSNAPR